MKVKIKTCGLKRPQDIDYANDLKPDLIGFVFAESKRQVSLEQAKTLRKLLDKNIEVVGVFTDEKIENIKQIFEEGIIDIAQLHGAENIDYILQLKKIPGLKIIKAIKVSDENLKDVEQFRKVVDFILFDSGAGGGKVFSWEKIKNYTFDYFLAGGLDLSNVSLAVDFLQPFGLDVSSGIETDGVKDYGKMKEFIKLARM
ncbi:MAG: phosphoribosylanthranilate isomerase [Elusimicrobiota bacterium]|nr:phosphoribosylanthranilate isomerase [Elusimicrobiota bacterium]